MEFAETTIISKDRVLSELESDYNRVTASENALQKQNEALSEECSQLKETNSDNAVLIENLQNDCSILKNQTKVFDQESGLSRFMTLDSDVDVLVVHADIGQKDLPAQ